MKNKFLAIVFSFVVAFGLWLYVITVVSPESEKTYFDIPVVLQNKEVLEQRGLMIVSETPKVTLSLKSDRTILNDLNENNINVIANLTTVETAGTHNLTYTISYPGNISQGSVSVQSSSTEMITLKVENRITRKIPLVAVAKDGAELPKDYYTDLSKAQFITRHDNIPVYITHVEVSGPETVVNPIAQAVVELDVNGQTVDIKEKTETYTLCDEDGEAVNVEKVTTNVDVVEASLQIVKEKTVAIAAQIIPGKGAEESNAKVTLSQQSIVVRGGKDRVDALPDSVTIPVDLSKYLENSTFEVDLNELGLDLSGMEIQTGKTTVEVTLEFEGVKVGELTLPVKVVNLPKKFEIASQTEEITVTIRGPVEDMQWVWSSDFVAQVDCANAKEGRNELEVSITCEKYPKIAVTNADQMAVVDVKLIPQETTVPTDPTTPKK